MTKRRRIMLASIGGLSLAAFLTLAYLVTHGSPPLVRLDTSWHQDLRRYGIDHPGWLSTMRVITHLGDTATILVVDVILFAVCLVRRWMRQAVFVAIVGLGGWALRLVARDVTDQPRPDDPLWPADGPSFPSGHTTNTALTVVLVSVVCWPLVRPALRPPLVAGAASYAVAVGLSRVAGAVHWPTDVIGGLLFASGFASVVAAAFPWAERADPTAEPPIRIAEPAPATLDVREDY